MAGDSIVSTGELRARLKGLHVPELDNAAITSALRTMDSSGFVGDRVFVRTLAWTVVPTSDYEFEFCLEEARASRPRIVESAQRVAAALTELTVEPAASNRRFSSARRCSRTSVALSISPRLPRRVWSAGTLNLPSPISPRYPRYDPIHFSLFQTPPVCSSVPELKVPLTPRPEMKVLPTTASSEEVPPELREVAECELRFDQRRAALRERTTRMHSQLDAKAALLATGPLLIGPAWEYKSETGDGKPGKERGVWMQTVLHLFDNGDLVCQPAEGGLVSAVNLPLDCVRYSTEVIDGFPGGACRLVLRVLQTKRAKSDCLLSGRRDLCLAWKDEDSPPFAKWDSELRRHVRLLIPVCAAYNEQLVALELEADTAACDRRQLTAVLQIQRWIRDLLSKRAQREQRVQLNLEIARLAYALRLS